MFFHFLLFLADSFTKICCRFFVLIIFYLVQTKNCMTTHHWVRDRVLDWMAKDPTIGVKALQKRLEEQYHLQLSCWLVWDGRNIALE